MSRLRRFMVPTGLRGLAFDLAAGAFVVTCLVLIVWLAVGG